MKKMLIFLDELYFEDGNDYISSYAAGSFFDDINGAEKTFLVPVSPDTSKKPKQYSSKIDSNIHKVIKLPEWNSVISYIKKSISPSFQRRNQNILKKAVKENDVVWIRVPSLIGLKLAKETIQNHKRVIFHFAGDIGEAWKNGKYTGLKKAFAFFLSKYMHYKIKRLSKSDYVSNLCTGDTLYKYFKAYNKNTDYFIDSKIYKSDLQSHEYNKEVNRFLYIGRFTEDKGIRELINIFEQITESDKTSVLSIIGFGEQEEILKEIISKSKNSHRYNYIGFVPNHEIYKHIKNQDILLFPSKAPTEGFPRVIIEAWANGLMVLSSDIGGIKGLGVEKKNILFSPVKDYQKFGENIQSIIDGNFNLSEFREYIINNRDNITYEYYKSIAEKHIYEL